MTTTAIIGGRILDQNGERSSDLLVDADSGLIVEIGSGLTGDTTIDATGCVVASGLVDLHAQLRQPGDEAAETIKTASRAAALGGYSAVVAMPTSDPCADNPSVVKDILALAADALCEIVPAGTISVGRAGEELAPLGELADLGVRIFSDVDHCVQNAGFLRRALEYAGSIRTNDSTSIVLAQHGDDENLSLDGVMHEGVWSSRLGLAGVPPEAEELMIMRDVALSRLTGVHIHMQRVSTARSVEIIRAAKHEGLSITAEVTPHHFTLTDEACATYDPSFKVSPPLRTAADVQAIRDGLADGTIDAIVTDHAPHAPDAKERPFDQAPSGSLGLQTSLAVAMTELELPLDELVALFSWRPAQISGLAARHGRTLDAGAPANLAVIDPHHEWTVDGNAFASRATNTLFNGRALTGKVRHTIYEGNVVVHNFEAVR